MNKDAVSKSVVRMMEQYHASLPESKGPIGHYCLFWAAMTVAELNRLGIKAQVNAGSAHWVMSEDDGVNPFSFAYQFEWNQQSLKEIQLGLLPEMHVWACVATKDCPEGRGQIIDMTTRYVCQRASEHLTPTRTYPDYLWFYLDDLPDGVSYDATMQATAIAYAFLQHSQTGVLQLSIVEPLKDE